MTITELFNQGKEKLVGAGIPDAANDAFLLLSFVTKVTRSRFYAHPELTVSKDEERLYLRLISKRKDRIPLQHLTGECDFMGYTFYVNENVLIPRQDTEILAETALSFLRGSGSFRILDIGTGSGCILLSIIKFAEQYDLSVSGVAADISAGALDVAKKNAERLGISKDRVSFIESDLFSSINSSIDNKRPKAADEEKFDLIISNPPYIPTSDIDELQDEVRFYDPAIALDGGEDGLDFYRKIAAEAPDYLRESGELLLEIGFNQAKDVSAILKSDGFTDIVVKKDLAGLDRVVIAR
ncbi:MAG: peptide chain release factor N(5)-glutamine methyltransferase [Lachnospiraceae bacterium]|nr:peptide chain release factor N(5)-glutamine methyltransferase [Lachnospiraceae bacterium]